MNNDYMEFAEIMRRGIESVKGKEVKLHAVKKNNGVVLYGITIYTEGCNIMPTLYLESYYEDYKNGKPIKDVACEFMREYDRSLINENFNIDFFEDYEQVKPLLGYKLINADMNVDLLKEVPHVPYRMMIDSKLNSDIKLLFTLVFTISLMYYLRSASEFSVRFIFGSFLSMIIISLSVTGIVVAVLKSSSVHIQKDRRKTWSMEYNKLEGHDFEYYCADLLARKGFRKVTVT